jgi:RNA polymerase sigma factor (sigma-70 family)
LFRHFHGRSSLATWLRAVLAQRHVDRFRASRRVVPLPDDQSPGAIAALPKPADPARPRYLALLERALTQALTGLDPRDRLRLGCYYAQGMTLAAIGKLVGEHEATVSRHLSRTRRIIRGEIERQLRLDGLGDAEMAECFECVLDDAGPIDLTKMLASGDARKESDADRSVRRGIL